MATSAEPDRDGADSRTDGPTKASEQIRASTSMSTFMSCASRIFVGAPKGVAGTAVSGRPLSTAEYIPYIGVRVGVQPAHMDSLFAKAAKQTDEA